MATDYRFAIRCWQDSAGSEDATINVFVDGTQVATNVAVTATSNSSPQVVSFEATGLPDPNADGSVTCAIKVVLTNEYYVDASTDRNVWINGIGTLAKENDPDEGVGYYGSTPYPLTTFTDFSEFGHIDKLPTAVTGDQIPSSFWSDALASNSGNGSFYHIPIWGSNNTDGVTITVSLRP